MWMSRSVSRTAIATLGLVLGWAATAPAQSLVGVLLDLDTDLPVSAATVTLLDTERRPVAGAITGPDGRFAVQGTGAGRYWLRAERIGYQTTESPPMDLFPRDTVGLELRVSTDAVVFAPLTVTVASRTVRSRAMDQFYERRRRGRGVFFSPEDLERLRPLFAYHLLQQAPGVQLSYPRRGRPLVLMRQGARSCVPTLYVDGVRVPMDHEVSLDDWIAPGSLRAVEVYRSVHEVPVELQTGSNCGAIVAWTSVQFGEVPPRGRWWRAVMVTRVVLAAGLVWLASTW